MLLRKVQLHLQTHLPRELALAVLAVEPLAPERLPRKLLLYRNDVAESGSLGGMKPLRSFADVDFASGLLSARLMMRVCPYSPMDPHLS